MLGATLVVDGVATATRAEMPLERLEAEICELAGHLSAAECRWLLLLSEFDRRGSGRRPGGRCGASFGGPGRGSR